MGRRTSTQCVAGLFVALALAGALLPGLAAAEIISTTAAPQVFTVASQHPTLVSRAVTWQVTGTLPALPAGATLISVVSSEISSTGGVFMTDTGSLQSLGTAGPLPPQAGDSVMFPETITLSPDLVQRARHLRAQRILLTRTFEQRVLLNVRLGVGLPMIMTFLDTRTETVAFYLTTALGGPLRVFRVALRFDDGKVQRLVQPEEDLEVWADIDFTGSGRLRAVWEIADSASTSGAPIFRPLPGSDLDRLLGAGQRLSIPGPRLPTWQAGLYQVRLRILEPGSAFGDPQITYHVLGTAHGGAQGHAGNLRVTSPAPDALLVEATEFVWEDVAGAVVYRLEFFAISSAGQEPPLFSAAGRSFRDVRSSGGKPLSYELPRRDAPDLSEEPLAGVLLPRDETRTGLSLLTRTRLIPGQSYLWRVRAIGGAGGVLGTSPVRTLRIPPVPASDS